jgi:simple sugar transport system substrate-binding protein
MRRRTLLATAAAVAALVAGYYGPAQAAEPLGKGMTIYMQMGGNAGDGATWARTNGALAAGDAFGIKVIEQYSAWQPEKMLEQFRQALAAKPDCIEIMGHPGNDAFEPLVKQARDRGIIITVGNSPLTKIQKMYGSKGTGYAGVELYAGGAITASKMLDAGLKSGDKALVYGLLGEAERGQSDKGLKDTLEKVGVKVDYLEISAEVNSDSSLAVPVLTAYIAKNPNVKGIGTQHGGVTSVIPKALQAAGKKPGEVIVGGIDLSPATIDGLEKGWITVTLDQQLYLQGFLPVLQCVLSVKYKMGGFTTNTAAGTLSPKNVDELVPLIDQGIR